MLIRNTKDYDNRRVKKCSALIYDISTYHYSHRHNILYPSKICLLQNKIVILRYDIIDRCKQWYHRIIFLYSIRMWYFSIKFHAGTTRDQQCRWYWRQDQWTLFVQGDIEPYLTKKLQDICRKKARANLSFLIMITLIINMYSFQIDCTK